MVPPSAVSEILVCVVVGDATMRRALPLPPPAPLIALFTLLQPPSRTAPAAASATSDLVGYTCISSPIMLASRFRESFDALSYHWVTEPKLRASRERPILTNPSSDCFAQHARRVRGIRKGGQHGWTLVGDHRGAVHHLGRLLR